MDHGELIEKANEYKKLEERLSKEEFEEAQEKMKNEYLEQEKIRESEKKIWSMDGQVMNKKKFKKEDKKDNK